MYLKKLFFFVLVSGFFLSCHSGQEPSSEKMNISPKNLADVIHVLDERLGVNEKEEIRKTGRRDLGKYHLKYGMSLRAEWQLWHDSELVQYFKANGIYHADDMSDLIFDLYWKHLNSLPLSLKESVAHLRQQYDELAKRITIEEGVIREGDKVTPLPHPGNVKEDLVKLK